jgi:hypothetical protein
MFDASYNRTTQNFSASPEDESRSSIVVSTANPDGQDPELDLSRITISATPTKPFAPDGETAVSVVFYARDDKSGLREHAFTLIDPQGISHYYRYFADGNNVFFTGDPTVWTRYEATILLAIGSAPGRWSMASMKLTDFADNSKLYDFVEILHFELVP